MKPTTRLVEVRQKVLNRTICRARASSTVSGRGIFVVSLVSSPGSGKTAFLEQTLTLLRPEFRTARWWVTWPPITTRSAGRSQVPVKQIVTGTVCHLEAEMVRVAMEAGCRRSWRFCLSKMSAIWVSIKLRPREIFAGIDVGDGGEDKPLKYPTIFNTADVA